MKRSEHFQPEVLSDQPDFSLVLGGPLFQLFRRAHLSGSALEMVRRRVVVIALVAWLPLLVLSVVGGHAWAGTIKVPFLYDIEAHIRFLIALPVLIAAELIVHSRIRPAVKSFLERHVIIPEDIPRFDEAINSAVRLRNSVAVEVGILILVYTAGLWIWRSSIATGAASWSRNDRWVAYASRSDRRNRLPWRQQLRVWADSFCSRHPAGRTNRRVRVLYEGQNLVAFFVLFVLGPLIVFTPHLARAKREGLRDYGQLAGRYVQSFEEKWIHKGASSEDELLGSGDIQSLADLGNSFTVVQEMCLVPFGLKDAGRLAVATAAPLIPLGLTIFSLEELVSRLIKILF